MPTTIEVNKQSVESAPGQRKVKAVCHSRVPAYHTHGQMNK